MAVFTQFSERLLLVRPSLSPLLNKSSSSLSSSSSFIVPIPRHAFFRIFFRSRKWSRAKPHWACMKTLTRLRQVRKRGGCQAAKTEVSCVNHERTIRFERERGSKSHFWSSWERYSWNTCKLSKDPREIIAGGLDQNFLLFGYF